MAHDRNNKPGAAVDELVDENGSQVDVPDDSLIRPAEEDEQVIGATSPTNWWRLGLVALAIVAAILLFLQLMRGAPDTAVQPGTPVAEPDVVPDSQ